MQDFNEYYLQARFVAQTALSAHFDEKVSFLLMFICFLLETAYS